MKKITLLLIVLFVSFVSIDSFAQRSYEKGDKTFMAGLSFGSYGYGYGGTRSGGMIPLYASLEFGVHENFSVGPYIGYASYNYDWGFGSKYKWNFLSVGAKGSWHYLPAANEALGLNIDDEKFDFYLSLFLGFESRTFSGDAGVWNYGNSSNIVFAPVLGFKYLFTPSVGAFVELGRGTFGYGTVGISARF